MYSVHEVSIQTTTKGTIDLDCNNQCLILHVHSLKLAIEQNVATTEGKLTSPVAPRYQDLHDIAGYFLI